jgi:hypothetical protein
MAQFWKKVLARWLVAFGVFVALVFLVRELVIWHWPTNRRKDTALVQALVEAQAAALAANDERAVCSRLWFSPPGSDPCRAHVRWFREHAPDFARSRFTVKSVSSDSSRTRIVAIVRAENGSTTRDYELVAIVSCDAHAQVIGPHCPLWVSGIDPVGR